MSKTLEERKQNFINKVKEKYGDKYVVVDFINTILSEEGKRKIWR